MTDLANTLSDNEKRLNMQKRNENIRFKENTHKHGSCNKKQLNSATHFYSIMHNFFYQFII